ncbi:MAG: hypothetical protein ACK5IJ_06670 [Mangrovibacterium sp.]
MEQEKSIKKDAKLLVIVLLMLAVFIGPMIIFSLKDSKRLEKEPVLNYGIVQQTYAPVNGSNYTIRYKYEVKGLIYEAADATYNPRRQKINVGDTCEIIYARTQPEISSVLELENGLLNIRNRKRKSIVLPKIEPN